MKELLKQDPSLIEAMEETPEVSSLFEEEISAAISDTVESVSNATGEIESLVDDEQFEEEPALEFEDESILDPEDPKPEGSPMPMRNCVKKSAFAVLALIAVTGGIVVIAHKLNPYHYFHEGHLEYRTDTWTGETDMLVPAGQWRITQIDRPPQTITIPEDADSAVSGDVTISGETWDPSSNQVCAQVSSGNHVLKSVDAEISTWLPHVLDDATKNQSRSDDSATPDDEVLDLYPPEGHGLVQPHETVSMCGTLKTLQRPNDNKWELLALDALGWAHH